MIRSEFQPRNKLESHPVAMLSCAAKADDSFPKISPFQDAASPQRTAENSPAIYRWDKQNFATKSVKRTAEIERLRSAARFSD